MGLSGRRLSSLKACGVSLTSHLSPLGSGVRRKAECETRDTEEGLSRPTGATPERECDVRKLDALVAEQEAKKLQSGAVG